MFCLRLRCLHHINATTATVTTTHGHTTQVGQVIATHMVTNQTLTNAAAVVPLLVPAVASLSTHASSSSLSSRRKRGKSSNGNNGGTGSAIICRQMHVHSASCRAPLLAMAASHHPTTHHHHHYHHSLTNNTSSIAPHMHTANVTTTPPSPSSTSPSTSSSPPSHESCPISPKKSFYQRPLPSALLPFASNEGRKVFREALIAGGMEGYFNLAAQFQTQSEPAYCGPTTLAMILNSLSLDPRKIWKGGWRWYSEEMLDSCDASKPKPLHEVDSRGMSYEEFWFMAECNGAAVQSFRGDDNGVNEASFRASLHAACTRTDIHMVASFSRAVLGQTGAGHYSPIAGYHAERDLCLVLDVARFKYPPYWLPVSTMWKSIQQIDPETGRPRGYFLVSRAVSAATPTLVSASSIASATAHVRATTSPATIAEHNQHHHQHHHHETTDNGTSSSPSESPVASVTAEAPQPLSSTCRIAVDKMSWAKLAEHFCVFLPNHLRTMNLTTPEQVFTAILQSLPVALSSIFTMYTHDLTRRLAPSAHPTSECNHQHHDSGHAHGHSHGGIHTHTPRVHSHIKSRNSLVKQSSSSESVSSVTVANGTPITTAAYGPLSLLINTPLYRTLEHALPRNTNHDRLSMKDQRYSIVVGGAAHDDRVLASLLLLACPQQIFMQLHPSVRDRINTLRDLSSLPTTIQDEVRNLREQMGILAEYCICDHQSRSKDSSTSSPVRHRFVSPTSNTWRRGAASNASCV